MFFFRVTSYTTPKPLLLLVLAGAIASVNCQYEDAFCIVQVPKGARTISNNRFEIERIVPRDTETINVMVEVRRMKPSQEEPHEIKVYNSTPYVYSSSSQESSNLNFYENYTRAEVRYNVTLYSGRPTQFVYRMLKPRSRHPLCHVTIFTRKSFISMRNITYPYIGANLEYLPSLSDSKLYMFFYFDTDKNNFPSDVAVSRRLTCGPLPVSIVLLETGSNIFYANRTELEGYSKCSYTLLVASNSSLNRDKDVFLPKSIPHQPSTAAVPSAQMVPKRDYDTLLIIVIVLGVAVAALLTISCVLSYKLCGSNSSPEANEATLRHIHDVNINSGQHQSYSGVSLDDQSFREVVRTHIPPSPEPTTLYTGVNDTEADGIDSNVIGMSCDPSSRHHGITSSRHLQDPQPLDENRM